MPSTSFKFSPATFYTSPICPYAQRVSIALLELGLIDSIAPKEYSSGIKIVEIDLKNKPDWYMRDINPKGKVPSFQITLPDQQTPVLVESDLIAHFIYNAHASPLLHQPLSQPYLFFKGQLFLNQFQSYITQFYTLLRAKQPDQQQEAKTAFLSTIRDISSTFLEKSHSGPFSLGATYTWFDLLVASFLIRLPILKHYRQFEIPNTPEYQRFHDYIKACIELPNVKLSTSPLEDLIRAYSSFAQN